MKVNSHETLEECLTEIDRLRQENQILKEAYYEVLDSTTAKNNIMDDAHLGEIQLDGNSVITGANRGFEVLLGYSEGELHGLTFYDILAEGHEIHDSIFPTFKKMGVIKNVKWKMKSKQGKHILVTLTGRAVYDDNGEFKTAVGLISDISELVHASEALRVVEREKTLIMDIIQDCIIYYDPGHRVIWANKMASIISGIPIDDLQGKKCFQICHKNDSLCKGCPMGDPDSSKEPKSGEVRSNDMIFYVMTYPVIDEYGKYTGIVQVIRDITEEKMLEREVLEISSTERKKIGNDLHDGLGQILTGISFMSSALINNLASSKHPSLNIAENIESQAKKAISMMKDILRGLCPVTEDPDGLTMALENLASTVTCIYRIKCTFSSRSCVQVDNYDVSNNLYLIAREAVTNAIKHSGGTAIEISLESVEDGLALKITDNGIGFSEKMNNYNSLGQGLRTMKYRVSLLGGDIEFISEANNGTGTTVSVYIN